MKKKSISFVTRTMILLGVLFFGIHYTVRAQSDTIVVIYDESKPDAPYEIRIKDKVIIFADDVIKIENKTYNKKTFDIHWAGLELGFNGYVNDDWNYDLPSHYSFLDLKNTKSTNFNWNIFDIGVNLYKQKLGIGFGLGLQWNNYRFHNNVVLSPDSTGINGYEDPSLNAVKSKLMVLWARAPILLEYHKNKKFFVSAGIVFGVRLGTHSKQVYYENDSRKKPKQYSDFYLSPFKVDGEFRIGYKAIGIFASYSLTEMYKSGKGPVLHPYTAGISLIF